MRRSNTDSKDKQGRGGRRTRAPSRFDINTGISQPQSRMQNQGRASSPKAISNFKLIIPKPQAIVMDLLGVLVCKSFMTSSKEFRDYFQHNILEYLNDNWKQKQLKVMINFFRCSQANVPDEYKLAERDEPKEDQIKQAKKHIIWKLRNDPTNSALSLFMLGITEWGYKNKTLQTSIYDEIPATLKMWKEQKIPVYVGVGSADFLIMVLQNTIAGNLLQFFHGHMNIMDFDGTRANKDFKKLSSLLHLPPDKILYLTRFRQDCKRALESGLQSVIVLRSDFDSHGMITSIRSKRGNMTSIDGTRLGKIVPDDPASPPTARVSSSFHLPELKNDEQMRRRYENISIIEDHEEAAGTQVQSSQIVEQDIGRYNMVLSLSELAFK